MLERFENKLLFEYLIIYIIISLFRPSVCVTDYRLGLSTSYKIKIIIIRTGVIWKGDKGGKFSRRVAELLAKKDYDSNAFLWLNFSFNRTAL